MLQSRILSNQSRMGTEFRQQRLLAPTSRRAAPGATASSSSVGIALVDQLDIWPQPHLVPPRPRVLGLESLIEEYGPIRGSIATSAPEEARTIDPAITARLTKLEQEYFLDEGKLLKDASKNAFLEWLDCFPQCATPQLSAEPSGDIIGTWENAEYRVTIRFIHSSKLHYSMKLAGPEGVQRKWGEAGLMYFPYQVPEAYKRICRV